MRSECDMQALVASGKHPEPAGPVNTPRTVPPPIFDAVRVGVVEMVKLRWVMHHDPGSGVGFAFFAFKDRY